MPLHILELSSFVFLAHVLIGTAVTLICNPNLSVTFPNDVMLLLLNMDNNEPTVLHDGARKREDEM